jgi:hypothetical protein
MPRALPDAPVQRSCVSGSAGKQPPSLRLPVAPDRTDAWESMTRCDCSPCSWPTRAAGGALTVQAGVHPREPYRSMDLNRQGRVLLRSRYRPLVRNRQPWLALLPPNSPIPGSSKSRGSPSIDRASWHAPGNLPSKQADRPPFPRSPALHNSCFKSSQP